MNGIEAFHCYCAAAPLVWGLYQPVAQSVALFKPLQWRVGVFGGFYWMNSSTSTGESQARITVDRTLNLFKSLHGISNARFFCFCILQHQNPKCVT